MTTTDQCPPISWEARPPSPRAHAAMVATMSVLVVLVVLGEAASGQWWPLTDVGLGAVAVALVALLSRRPVTIAVVLAVLALASPVLVPASSGATYYVARTRPAAMALVVTALATLTHSVRGVWRPVEGLELGWWVIIVIAVHTALLGWGSLGRSRAHIVAALLERARLAEGNRDARERRARADERAAIAREMHDVLAHRLSLVATYSGALEVNQGASPEQVARAASVVREHTHLALDELREVIGVLRDDPHDDGPLRPLPGWPDLPGLVEESRAAGVEVLLLDDVTGAEDLPAPVGRTAYRVVQESLTNARKHAPGSGVEVNLVGASGRGLDISVVSGAGDTTPPDGAAPMTSSGGASGLVGLTERVGFVGGTLEHGHVDGGFRVHARLPWT